MCLPAAEFDVRRLAFGHQGERRLVQHVAGFGIGRQRAAFDAKRRGDKSAAKKQASLMHEGKNAGDLSGFLGEKKMRLEAENGFEDPAPARQMKECSPWRTPDECIPLRHALARATQHYGLVLWCAPTHAQETFETICFFIRGKR